MTPKWNELGMCASAEALIQHMASGGRRIVVPSIEAENPVMTEQETKELQAAADSINYLSPPKIPDSIREFGRKALTK